MLDIFSNKLKYLMSKIKHDHQNKDIHVNDPIHFETLFLNI